MTRGGDEISMSPNPHSDHPVDALAEYARGTVDDADGIERHLAVCGACRLELEIVRALAADAPAPLTDIERRAVYRSFEARRRTAPSPRRAWLAATWRVAAGAAILLTSVGVWSVVNGGSRVSEWNPEAALEGFRRDLADLDVAEGDVRAVLGAGLLDDPGAGVPWDGFEATDPGDVRPPWEEDR